MVGFTGNTEESTLREADKAVMLPLGQLTKLIAFMHKNGAAAVCFAGAIKKPNALNFRPDMLAMKAFFSLRGRGDDAVLRALADILAKENLPVINPTRFAPALLAPEGVRTKRNPTEEEWTDIRFALPIAKTVGKLDIGQLVVVKKGVIMAVEAIEGTDAALERGGQLGGKGCVALKVFKPGQDNRMDQPAMGPKTIRVLAKHGYTCLAYEARNALFFDFEEAVHLADCAGITIIGLRPEDAD